MTHGNFGGLGRHPDGWCSTLDGLGSVEGAVPQKIERRTRARGTLAAVRHRFAETFLWSASLGLGLYAVGRVVGIV